MKSYTKIVTSRDGKSNSISIVFELHCTSTFLLSHHHPQHYQVSSSALLDYPAAEMARIAPEGFVMPDNILDPNTATRDDFSKQAMAFEIPADASQDYKKYAEPLKDLYGHLAYHKAMASNLHQTFMTPAASKNRVYFMWDFVGRTLVSSQLSCKNLSVDDNV